MYILYVYVEICIIYTYSRQHVFSKSRYKMRLKEVSSRYAETCNDICN